MSRIKSLEYNKMDAMYGRTTSLKTNYMIDNKSVQAYLKKLQSSSESDNREKAQKWKDAFNSKGSVNNKQEYLDLLMDYVRKETNYNGLTEKYAKTLSGQMDRLSGYWDTLKADLLGIDINTGMAKEGKITVFSSIKNAIDGLSSWLEEDSTKQSLDKIGDGIATAVSSIVGAMKDLTKDGTLDKVADVFVKLGNSIKETVDKLKESGVLEKFIESLPDLADKAIGNKIIDGANTAIYNKDMAENNYGGGFLDWIHGFMVKSRVLIGTESSKQALNDESIWSQYSTGQKVSTIFGINPNFQWNLNPNDMLTDANAWQALNENHNLSDYQRQNLKDVIDDDNTAKYNITIQEIRADNFDQIMDSIKQYQNNKK